MLRALLSDEKRFCQGAMARDGAGRSCLPSLKDARAWCVIGGLEKIAWNGQIDSVDPTRELDENLRARMLCAFQVSAKSKGHLEAVNTINDYKGWRVVLDIIDTAIQTEEGK